MNVSRLAAYLALILAISTGAASWAASDTPRLPRPRPATTPPAETIAWAGSAETRFQDAMLAVDGLARLPRPRPPTPTQLAMVSAEDDDHEETISPLPIPPIDVMDDAEFASCLDRLRELGVEFEVGEPIHGGNGCEVPHPLTVTALGSGVAIEPETLLNCAMTGALATWVRDVLLPESIRTLGAKPTEIRQDSAYVCRTRNNDPNAKISEHARANAIDIADFKFADHDPVGIGANDSGSAEARFEANIRAGSCRYFTTVLGPGSNAAHATHFHFDLAKRNGGYRLCELGEPKIVRGPENTTRE